MKKEKVVFICENIGVGGTTKCHVQQGDDGKYEARMGISIMGGSNLDEEGFKRADYNPFHKMFHDNYASGFGETKELAVEAMKADMKNICDSLWAF